MALVSHPDLVVFYCHRNALIQYSNNNFGALLVPPETQNASTGRAFYRVHESAEIVNAFLHILYDLDLSTQTPLRIISKALGALRKYGVNLESDLTAPSTKLHQYLTSRAESQPLEVYALAASLDMEALAVATSHNTLPIALSKDTTDELVDLMGPKYLHRLLTLHMMRTDALKRLLFTPFNPHPSASQCDEEVRRGFLRGRSI